MFGLKRKSVIYMSISDHEWAQFMSKQIVLAISMQIFDGFYKTSWSRPDTRLNDRLFARILKYVRHAIVWSLKFDMIDRIGRVNSCRESNSDSMYLNKVYISFNPKPDKEQFDKGNHFSSMSPSKFYYFLQRLQLHNDFSNPF